MVGSFSLKVFCSYWVLKGNCVSYPVPLTHCGQNRQPFLFKYSLNHLKYLMVNDLSERDNDMFSMGGDLDMC